MMKHVLLFGLLCLLAACSAPSVATPAPTPQAIHIIYPAVLKPWADKISRCASGNSQIALYFTPTSTQVTVIDADEIVLELGHPSIEDAALYLSQVGREQIVVAGNQNNNLSRLSTDQLRSIFSGQISRWEDGTSQPIQVWVLPEGDPVRMIFDETVLAAHSLSSNAMLAPDPGSMLEAISGDVNAIGYFLGSFLTSADPSLVAKIKLIQMDLTLEELHTQPVIAITQDEPQGLMRDLLVCLQSAIP